MKDHEAIEALAKGVLSFPGAADEDTVAELAGACLGLLGELKAERKIATDMRIGCRQIASLLDRLHYQPPENQAGAIAQIKRMADNGAKYGLEE